MKAVARGIAILLAAVASGCTIGEAEQAAVNDPLGPNAGCYVCHMTFVREELSVTHLRSQIGCIDCHGLSAAHANDEDVGATPPDIAYTRDQIDFSCGECHKTHDVPPDHVVALWWDRFGSEGRAAEPSERVVCTDCHGEHKIEEPAEESQSALPSTSPFEGGESDARSTKAPSDGPAAFSLRGGRHRLSRGSPGASALLDHPREE